MFQWPGLKVHYQPYLDARDMCRREVLETVPGWAATAQTPLHHSQDLVIPAIFYGYPNKNINNNSKTTIIRIIKVTTY